MAVRRCSHIDDYIGLLRTDDGVELRQLLASFSVKVSHFFRDPLVFEFLARVVLPQIAANRHANQAARMRIWSAGCSTGEETYSIAMLVRELRLPDQASIPITVFGTDIDEEALAHAREGLYSESDIGHVSHSRLQRNFTQHGTSYAVRPELRRAVRFVRHDLLEEGTGVPSESVFRGFDLIVCRHVMMYFNVPTQHEIFVRLDSALDEGGYLVLGPCEQPPDNFRRDYPAVLPNLGVFRKAPGHR